MEENEVLELLKSSKRQNNMVGILPGSDIGNTIIKALEDMQQYRALGTVEKLTANMEELKRWHTDKIAPNVKNPFAYTSTLCCCNCDHKDEYIEELEAEVEEYQQIGTPEECRAAMEKQTETLTVDKAKTIAAKAICIGCGYLADCKCDYNGGNCMVSKPMLESVLKSFDDWNRRANDGKTD